MYSLWCVCVRAVVMGLDIVEILEAYHAHTHTHTLSLSLSLSHTHTHTHTHLADLYTFVHVYTHTTFNTASTGLAFALNGVV